MAVTQNTYTGNGSTTNYSLTFQYLEEDEIKVSLNGTLTTAYTLANATTISFTTAPANGVAIRIYRDTNVDSLQSTFFAGSAIRAQDLNDNFNQVLYSTQETVARRVDSTGGSMTGNLEFSAGKGIVFEGATDDAHETTLLGGDPTADRTLNLPNVSGTLVSTGDTGTVTSTMLADNTIVNADINSAAAIDKTKISGTAITAADTGTVTSAMIADGAIVNADINASAAIAHSKLASVAAGSVLMGNATGVPTATAFTGDVTISSAGVTAISAGAVVTADLADQSVTSAKIADGVIDSTKLTGATVVTNAEHTGSTPNDTSFFTTSASDSRYFRQDSSETITSGNPWSSSDTYVATTAAIDARVIDLVDDVGGFVPITNETSFPLTNPDINNPDGSGTIISIKEIVTTRTPASGTVTIANGAGSNTVTINGCGSTVLASGFGVLVETTSTLHTYNFHRLVPKATEVTTVAGISGDITTVATNNANVTAVAGNAANINTVSTNIANVNNVGGSIANVNSVASNLGTVNDFAARYRVASSDPVTSLDTGDLVFNTTSSELRVYNGTSWQGGVTATGNLVSKSGDTMTGPLGVTAGTAALPSLFISGDPNTGIYSPGADQVAISTGGSGRLFVDASGNVGVGASSLSRNFTVRNASTIVAASLVSNPANIAYLLFGDTDADAQGRVQYNNSTDSLELYSAGSERLRITSAGLVGVGVSDPGQVLVIGGGTNGRARMKVTSGAGNFGKFEFSTDSSSTASTAQIAEISASIVGTGPLTSSLTFATNSGNSLNNAMTIDSSQRVGIGTSSPGAKLHSVETSAAEGLRVDGASGGFSLVVEGGTTRVTRARQATIGNSYVGNTPPTDGLIVQGSVGIGTASVNAKLEISGNSGGRGLRLSEPSGEELDISAGAAANDPARIATSSGSGIVFAVNGTAGENVRIDSSGRLGIGTSSPATALHVSGSGTQRIRITGTGAANAILSLDAPSTYANYIEYGLTASTPLRFYDVAATADRMIIDTSGRVGIGTTNPTSALHIDVASGEPLRFRSQTAGSNYFTHVNHAGGDLAYVGAGGGAALNSGTTSDYAIRANQGALLFGTNGNNERARIDSSGRLLVGTSSAQGQSIFQAVGNSSASTDPGDIRVIRGLNISAIGTNVGAELGIIRFGALENSVCAQISAVCDANWSANDTPGRLVFSTTADGASSPTERLRIANNGAWGLAGANYGSSGQVLTSNGSGSAPSWQAASAPAALSTASGSAPSYSVRAWAVWNGSNGSVSNSGNCSSVSRSANGRYQFNFNTALPSSNYVGIGGGSYRDGTDDGNAGYVTFRRVSSAAITTTYASLMSRAGGDWPDLPLSTFMVLC